jgi:UDPglucose 6-dehydrogenase
LKSAIGYGGPCFPRDNRAFAALGRKLGARCDLAEATDRINEYQLARLKGAVEASASSGQTVAVLGLSYKPDTGVIEAAQGVALAKLLAEAGYHVIAYDPLAGEHAHAVLGASVSVAAAAQAAIAEADVIVIMTPWNEFKALARGDFEQGGRSRIVIDPWRMLSAETAAGLARHIVPGAEQAKGQSRGPSADKVAAA